jgi:PAS domain S-box-containing protein/putative nucleotidyltransferase with HDIG domain
VKLSKLSLRVAVIIPYIAMTLFIVCIYTILWDMDYRKLAINRGEDEVLSTSEVTSEQLKIMLSEPMRLANMTADYISSKRMFSKENLSDIEGIQLKTFETLEGSLPQITVISYGDVMGNYVGIRSNKTDNHFSLMLKDERTDDKLVIYGGKTVDSEVIVEYDDYDPRTRPWYQKAILTPADTWSDVYINQDEKMEATITALVNIYGDYQDLKGVLCFDITLSWIHDFLKESNKGNNGVTYIIDQSGNLIAHSLKEDILDQTVYDSSNLQLPKAIDSKNILINYSSRYLANQKIRSEKPTQVIINKNNYFLYTEKLTEPKGLNWSTVTLVSETDIMGEMKNNQNYRILISILIAMIGNLLGYFVINSIIKPITRSTIATTMYAEGNLSIRIPNSKSAVKETKVLTNAFNSMAEKLQYSFEQTKHNEEKYKTLVENVDNMIISMDSRGIILSINGVFEKVTGFRKDRIIGKYYGVLFKDKEDTHYYDEKFKEINEKKSKITFTYTLINRKNVRSIHKVTFIPLLDDNQELKMILGSSADITDLCNAEEEIKRLHEIEKENLTRLVEEKTLIYTSQKEIILTLGEVAEKHFDETGSHVKRVSSMMYKFALLLGYSEAECEKIKLASILHDIGKIGIPESVLKKPGRLTVEEFDIIKEHTILGHKMLSKSNLDILQMAADIALNHHEKFNGTGYPSGLKGENISMLSRMLAIVDVYDAMKHKRVYKDADTLEGTLSYISSQRDLHFDGHLVDLFILHHDNIIDFVE